MMMMMIVLLLLYSRTMADENSLTYIYLLYMYNTTTYMDSGEIKFNKGGPWEEGEDRFGR